MQCSVAPLIHQSSQQQHQPRQTAISSAHSAPPSLPSILPHHVPRTPVRPSANMTGCSLALLSPRRLLMEIQ
ncbi:hypothetical protein E2C01_095886 [Portunus trituberculatus]|uniref:Uncharacterized protein n=1 Tax=Portunus trituberculatus TaxID=210409 RepID=A0A5B7K0K2_PORTR|nr:hypothetical protein [Portunus trituberculatus]